MSQELGRFAASLRAAELPDEVVDKAKACIAHGLVVASAGQATGFGELAEDAVGAAGGPSRLLSSDRWASPAQAAFVNAALAHGRVQEDTHGTSHLGTVVLPVAFAAADEVDADGPTLLAGIVAGYEVGAAVGRSMTARSSSRGFRASPIYGALAAAATAGRIRELDAERLGSAISFASAFTGGTLESFAAGTTEWHFQNGIAAQTGVLAAGLATAGAVASEWALEGEKGFLEAYCGTAKYAAEMTADLGTRWEILQVTFKLYPVCAFNQVPIAVAMRARESAGVAAEEIASLTLSMNPYEAAYPGMSRSEGFSTVAETLMSTRFTVATALHDGSVTYQSLSRFVDPAILELVDRIEIVPDEGRPQMTAEAVLRTDAGETAEVLVDDPSDLLSWDFDESPAQARALLTETRLSEGALAELLALVGRVETLERAGDLLRPLTEGA